MTKIAVLGHGVVGSGTVELFLKNRDSINKKNGLDLDLGYILDIRDFPGLPYSDKFTKDINDILNDPEVKVVAEVMGGLHPSFEFVKFFLITLSFFSTVTPAQLPTRSFLPVSALYMVVLPLLGFPVKAILMVHPPRFSSISKLYFRTVI